jgi:hypothetical protein
MSTININISKVDLGLDQVDNTSDLSKPISTATQTALDTKVDENAPITGATKTKITYDAKGLVTSGADATTADIADSTNKRYVTDSQATVIGNTSGTNTGDETVTTIKTKLGITTLSGSNTGDQSLSGVTAVGAITSDNITVQALNKQSGLNNSEIYSTDLITGARCSMNSNGSMGLKNAGTFEVLFKATNATASYNLEAPVKSAGTYTLALTSDLDAKQNREPNVQTVTSSATVTAVSTNDLVNITAQATGLTLANPTGTFYNGQIVSFRIKDNATPRTIAYGAKFKAFGSALPTTTVASKITLLSAMYNSVADTFEMVNSQEQ